MNKIKSLTIIAGTGVRIFDVDTSSDDPRGIGEIISNGMEFPDSIFSSYAIKNKKGKIISRVENCPVVIDYFEEPLTKEESEDSPF